MILDIAIRFLILGTHMFSEDPCVISANAHFVKAVVQAIIESWDPRILFKDEPPAFWGFRYRERQHSMASSSYSSYAQELPNHAPCENLFAFLKSPNHAFETQPELTGQVPSNLSEPGNNSQYRSDQSEYECSLGLIDKPRRCHKSNDLSLEEVAGYWKGWNLLESLLKQDLFFEIDPILREERIVKLSLLLTWRAVFVIALFMLMPDSTDVYLSSSSPVKTPMIRGETIKNFRLICGVNNVS
jgi:hypothetical protein